MQTLVKRKGTNPIKIQRSSQQNGLAIEPLTMEILEILDNN
jgi:hypothetical protein